MELPKPLAPWAVQLDLFPRELAGALGPLVQRIDRLVGPPRSRPELGLGEPDGFDGLDARGPYERLLLTEWLLATEAPEEFARRAAMNEHAFYRQVRKTPSGGRMSVALFDAGPDQWGSPRVAQLAALVVLARRAEAAGLRFLWGVAQTGAGENTLFDAVTPETVQGLLTARSARAAADDDLHAWRERFLAAAPKGVTVEDGWLIGGRRFAALPAARAFSQLTLADVYEPDGPPRVSVTAKARNGDAFAGRGGVTLELPDERLAVRLLRDPFDAATAAPSRAGRGRYAPASNLVFAGGVKLLARSSDGDLLSYPLPNSPRAPAGVPKRYRTQPGVTLLAAGRVKKLLVTVSRSRHDGALWVNSVGGGWWQLQGEYNYSAAQEPGPETPLGSVHGLPSGEVVALLAGGQMVRFSYTNGQRAAALLGTADGVSALAAASAGPHGLAVVTANPNFYHMTSFKAGSETGGPRHALSARRAPAKPEAFMTPVAGDNRVVHAALPDGGEWKVFPFNLVTGEWKLAAKVAPPPRARVVGLTTVPGTIETPCLVALEEDGRTFTGADPTGTKILLRAPAEVEHVAVNLSSSNLPLLAFSTKTGEVGVYSLAHREYVYRLLPEAEEPAQGTLPLLEIPQRDEQTGLLTKAAARDRIAALKPPYTVMLLSLEGIEAWRDQDRDGRDGRDAALLQQLGAYLRSWTEGTGRLAARTAETEFLLALPHEVQTQAAQTYAATLRRQIAERCLKDTSIDAALGLARCPQNGVTLDGVLRAVGEALSLARQKGPGGRIHIA